MIKEDMAIQFSGFEPNSDVRSNLYFLLNQILLKSPSRSFLCASFTLTNGIFEGVVKITSAAENFVAKATDVHIVELAEKLSIKVGDQLEKWKSLRFD